MIFLFSLIVFFTGVFIGLNCTERICRENEYKIYESGKVGEQLQISKDEEDVDTINDRGGGESKLSNDNVGSESKLIIEHDTVLRHKKLTNNKPKDKTTYRNRKMNKNKEVPREENRSRVINEATKLNQPYKSVENKFKHNGKVLQNDQEILEVNLADLSKKTDNLAHIPREGDVFSFVSKSKESSVEAPLYIQIRESDSPTIGDFHCGGTEVPRCCAFYVNNIGEAKKICDSYRDFCKGFVLSTLSEHAEKLQYLMYLKNNIEEMTSNFLTDFFVKSRYIKSIGWRSNSVKRGNV